MWVISYFETSVDFHRTTRLHIPQIALFTLTAVEQLQIQRDVWVLCEVVTELSFITYINFFTSEVHFLSLYLLHFPTIYALSNVTLRKGRASTAWEPRKQVQFFSSLKWNVRHDTTSPVFSSVSLSQCSYQKDEWGEAEVSLSSPTILLFICPSAMLSYLILSLSSFVVLNPLCRRKVMECLVECWTAHCFRCQPNHRHHFFPPSYLLRTEFFLSIWLLFS
jgi:hypothetical protein